MSEYQTVQYLLPMDSAVSDFMLHQRSSRHSPTTIQHYKVTFDKLGTFLAENGVQDVAQVTPSHLRAFLLTLEHLKPRTRWGIACDIRAFFSFLERDELIRTSPMRKVSMPRQPKSILPAFTAEEVRKLLKAVEGKDRCSLRNRAMLLVLLDSGIRLGELAAMKVGDVDVDTGSFKVMGKGSKERVCHLSPHTLKHLARYVRHFRPEPNQPLWGLTRFSIANLVKRIGRRAGVHAHPHKFRRTCALTMLKNGCDVFTLQYLLGHSDLTVLRMYLAQTKQDLKEAHQKYSAVQALV